MINAMQNYYPEALGLGLVLNASWTFNTVWNVIKSWLDPVLASKIHFVKSSKELAEYINRVFFLKRLGGKQMDFKLRPPTKEDEALVKFFREDK
ncbi:unnamed protein product [Rotaria socialis]|nr:unnamed protein product [Rotaria socialis]CAF3498903.1 unnamed protein product [Rotaria socialis]CAF4324244.1 unnamed protein product [Rotaria socialis]